MRASFGTSDKHGRLHRRMPLRAAVHLQRAAAGTQLRAVRAGFGDEHLHGLRAARIRHRAHLARLGEAIAYAQRFGARREPFDEARVDLLVHVVARGRDAHLAGVAILRADGEVEHLLDIHVVEYEHGAVAAELHRRALHAVRGELHELLADRNRAGEVNGADHGRADEMRRHEGRNAEDHGQHALRQTRVDERARHFQRRARRLLGRLQDAGAAGAERGADLASGIADRKIPRRERGHGADGLLDHRHAHAGGALRQHAAVGATALFRVPVEDVRGQARLPTSLRRASCLPR